MENKQPCSGCGSLKWYHISCVFNKEGIKSEWCSECSNESMPSLSPDVYFDSSKGANQIDPNLCDRYTGPIPFSSKREKAAILKRLGLREDGDKQHGSRNFDKQGNKNNWH